MAKSTNPLPGQIKFYDNFLPKLASGNYTISAGSKITGAGIPQDASDKMTISQPFVVSGPRFVLPADEVHSVYPSPGVSAHYDGVLPQIVFRKKILPWERNLTYQPASPAKYATPWLALVLLTEDEIIIAPGTTQADTLRTLAVTRPMEDLFPAGLPNGYLPPDITTQVTDPNECYMLDLSVSSFKNLLPHLSELPYLSSVRQVNIEHKEFMGMKEDGWFSMLLGNRLAQTNYNQGDPVKGTNFVRNIVHLVSIEGFGAYLDPASATYKNFVQQGDNWVIKDQTNTYDKVRLASLASWDFYCKPVGDSFAYIMENMNVGLLQSNKLKAAQASGNDYLSTVMSGGYTPLKYYPRSGGTTVAMYRGPLTPVINTSNPTNTGDTFYAAASSMVYDQSKGIYDLSYAVAWQIGRLLALSDSHYSQSILTWKRKFKEQIEMFFERYNIHNRGSGKPLPPNDFTLADIQELMSHDFPKNQFIEGFLRQMEALSAIFKTYNVDNQLKEETIDNSDFKGILSDQQYDSAGLKGANLVDSLLADLNLK